MGGAGPPRSEGVPDATLVRDGATRRCSRVAIGDGAGRTQLVEAELRAWAATVCWSTVIRWPRTRDLLGALRVTVFSRTTSQLVKGGPAGRRAYLDDLLVASAPRYAAGPPTTSVSCVTATRCSRAACGTPTPAPTLDVFDDQLVRAGAELVRGRLRLMARLAPSVERRVPGPRRRGASGSTPRYEAEWAEGATPAPDAVDRRCSGPRSTGSARRSSIGGSTLVGPHRDEWRLRVDGLDTRTHASQGEQRTLALALRLGGHRVAPETIGDDPVLLLDDVFSELDDRA